METPFPAAPEPISDESKRVVGTLLKKYKNNVRDAYDEFTKGSEERFTQGKAPNQMYGEVVEIFSKLLPLDENLSKIKSAQATTKMDIFNNLIYENVAQMNDILRDEIFEVPETKGLSPAMEAFEYEQALIEIFNQVPGVKDNEKRKDLLWVANLLNQMVGEIKLGERL